MSREYNLYKALNDYIPESALEAVVELIGKTPVQIKLTNKRESKSGDYLAPHKDAYHRISINADLNKYEFLITFLHEWAHLLVFKQYYGKVDAHGQEWKETYRILMQSFVEKGIFPEELNKVIKKHLRNIKASTFGDIDLSRVLATYNKKPLSTVTQFAEELAIGETFSYKNKMYQKIKKDRTYIHCKELSSNKMYKFHPLAKVISANYLPK